MSKGFESADLISQQSSANLDPSYPHVSLKGVRYVHDHFWQLPEHLNQPMSLNNAVFLMFLTRDRLMFFDQDLMSGNKIPNFVLNVLNLPLNALHYDNS